MRRDVCDGTMRHVETRNIMKKPREKGKGRKKKKKKHEKKKWTTPWPAVSTLVLLQLRTF